MTFQLESLTKVRVLDVRTLSSKDRKPGDPVGSQLLLRATLSSQALGMFDSFLPGLLYRMATGKKQGELDGIESAELTPIGDHVKRLPWVYEQTGCVVMIDFGTGGPSNINLADCKAHAVSIAPRQGGSVDVQWTVDAPALSTDTRGKLTDLKSTDVQMTMYGPTVQEDAQLDIEEGGRLAPNRKPGAPEKAAAKVPVKTAHKPTKEENRAAAQAAFTSDAKPKLGDEAAWPFPQSALSDGSPPPESVTRNPAQSRTARGREATKKALDKGSAL